MSHHSLFSSASKKSQVSETLGTQLGTQPGAITPAEGLTKSPGMAGLVPPRGKMAELAWT